MIEEQHFVSVLCLFNKILVLTIFDLIGSFTMKNVTLINFKF